MDLLLLIIVVVVLLVIVAVAAFASINTSLQKTRQPDQLQGTSSDPYQSFYPPNAYPPAQSFPEATYRIPASPQGVMGDQVLLRPQDTSEVVLPNDPTVTAPAPLPPPPPTTGLVIRAVRPLSQGIVSPSPRVSPQPTVNTPTVAGLTIYNIRGGASATSPQPTVVNTGTTGIHISPTRPTSLTAVPPEMGHRIPCPPALIHYNQKNCRICLDSIRFSYSRTGWARCLTTNRLVHGHCYNAFKASDTWCGICDGECTSDQPMSIEGVTE